MFIFDRCQRSWSAETPVKHKRDLIYLPYVLDKSWFPVMAKFANGALVPPHPWSKWLRTFDAKMISTSCDWILTWIHNIHHVRMSKRQYRAYHFQFQNEPNKPRRRGIFLETNVIVLILSYFRIMHLCHTTRPNRMLVWNIMCIPYVSCAVTGVD